MTTASATAGRATAGRATAGRDIAGADPTGLRTTAARRGSATSSTSALRVGTRASALARAQSGQVAAALSGRLGREAVLIDVRTHGDESGAPLSQLGPALGVVGVFVSSLREALLDGRVDIAVHSLKDLPTAPPEGIALAAVPIREDPRDALVSRDGRLLHELPPGARIGTGSPRRAAALAALGMGFEIVDIRGNVDSRLARVGGDLDAVVVALAGLRRLGRDGEASELLDPLRMLPAPGQGALAVETRLGDPLTLEVREALDDPGTRWAVAAERSVLATLAAGCSAPIGALADVAEPENGAAGAVELYLRASLGLMRAADPGTDADHGADHAAGATLVGAASRLWSGVTRASVSGVVDSTAAAELLGAEAARTLAQDAGLDVTEALGRLVEPVPRPGPHTAVTHP